MSEKVQPLRLHSKSNSFRCQYFILSWYLNTSKHFSKAQYRVEGAYILVKFRLALFVILLGYFNNLFSFLYPILKIRTALKRKRPPQVRGLCFVPQNDIPPVPKRGFIGSSRQIWACDCQAPSSCQLAVSPTTTTQGWSKNLPFLKSLYYGWGFLKFRNFLPSNTKNGGVLTR